MDALYPHTLPLISITTLSREEKVALLRLPMQVRDTRPDQDLVRQGDRPSQCCLVLEGVAATYEIGGHGKRQILAYHIAGDIPDLQSLHIEVMDTNLGTISPCKVAFIQHPPCGPRSRYHAFREKDRAMMERRDIKARWGWWPFRWSA